MMNIEYLPDELWLEIFEYIPYIDLFRCFTGLNKRINDILSSKRIKLQIKSNNHYQKFVPLIKLLPEYIIGLSIKYNDQDIDISPFKNLHSLHLSQATIKQLTQIQSNYFRYLNELRIVLNLNNYPLGDFLFGENQLNSLTTCWFPNLDLYFQDNKIYRSCLTLRSLRLNYCTMKTFFKLLSFLPNLNHFESALVSTISIIDQTIPFEHFNLIRLKIILRENAPVTDLQTILLNTPCLEQLYLNINRSDFSDERFDLILLVNLLEDRLKNCDIKINLPSNNFKIKLDDLKNISSLINRNNISMPQTNHLPTFLFRK